MDLLTIASGAAGVIAGLHFERSASFPKALAGGIIMGISGCGLTYGLGETHAGQPITALGAGVALGASVSSLSRRSHASSSALSGAHHSQSLPPPTPPVEPVVPSWSPMQAVNGSFSVVSGVHYRAVASVGTNYTKTQVQNYLIGNGWQTVMVYDTGDQLPADWPPENAGTLESGRRWVRVDAVRTGSATTQAAEPSILFFKFPIRIANVWTAP